MENRGGLIPHVVVVGAGFAGLSAVSELQDARVRITLVDRHTYATFQPLLYQVATAGLNPGDVVFPIRTLLRRMKNTTFRNGSIARVDHDAKRLIFDDDTELPYDYLVLAIGATTNYFGVPGAAEFSHAIYTLDDALRVRNRLFFQLERVEATGTGHGELTTVVVGGGATGVEMAGALAELRANSLANDYKGVDPSAARVILIEQQPRLLSVFDDRLSDYARRELRKRGVEVRTDETVKEIGQNRVFLGSGEEIECGMVLWAAGVGVDRVIADLGFPQGRGGRILVDNDLRITGRNFEFAVGDVAAATTQDGSALLPQVAQPAIQAGMHAAKQIKSLMTGGETTEFQFKDKGIMATIGRHAAVVKLANGVDMTGGLAWFAWLILHLFTLLGFRNRLSVLLNWTWHYLSWRRGPRVILGG
ncbi:MAG: NAD(P)/FAD-dependent oxidoreductase [Acidimicrobiaceae bacterium]|nr:NAD(P)/FAD-dependent oxidoreductase [Acidimicrobiaceae bacterium]